MNGKRNGRKWVRIGWMEVELGALTHNFVLVKLWRREAY
jgi:hypothetical protein